MAELLEYLGVSTRFQGGVELVRRCPRQTPSVVHIDRTNPRNRALN
ncbi:hypothetical protein ACFXKC_42285 [Streptomyces sp. NPDC059340]